MQIKLTLVSRHGKVKRYRSGTKRRFMFHLTHDKFSKAIVRVEYGKEKDNFGKMVMFFNEGEYTNKHDALQALRAFCEK